MTRYLASSASGDKSASLPALRRKIISTPPKTGRSCSAICLKACLYLASICLSHLRRVPSRCFLDGRRWTVWLADCHANIINLPASSAPITACDFLVSNGWAVMVITAPSPVCGILPAPSLTETREVIFQHRNSAAIGWPDLRISAQYVSRQYAGASQASTGATLPACSSITIF